MPLARYRDAGIVMGLGSDVAGGPDVSIFGEMRAAAYTQSGRRTMLGDPRAVVRNRSTGCGWGRSTARARLVSKRSIGSIETGKEADFICVDATATAPVAGDDVTDAEEICEPVDLPDAAGRWSAAPWVRGRRLPA